MEDILFIDKPKGMTSFDVIRMLRRRLGVRKMGHAGTLDPHASGLLIIGVGEATKRLAEYAGLPKTYVMDVLLGVKTDTGDIEGRVVEKRAVGLVAKEKIFDVLNIMIGVLELPVPAYSALKHQGKPRYAYARKGIAIEPKIRAMEIYALKLLDIAQDAEHPVLKAEMNCASGVYARSVAEEIGQRLGCPATLRDLRRTAIGSYRVEDAEHIDALGSPAVS